MEAFECGGPGGLVKNTLCKDGKDAISKENPWFGKINWEERPISLTLEDFRMINETIKIDVETSTANGNKETHGKTGETKENHENLIESNVALGAPSDRSEIVTDTTDTQAAEGTCTKISVENSETFELFEQNNKKEKNELLNNLKKKTEDIPLSLPHSSHDKQSMKEILYSGYSAKDSLPIKQQRLKSTTKAKKVKLAEKFFIKLGSLRSAEKRAKKKKSKQMKRLNGNASSDVAEKNFRGFRNIELEAAEKLIKTYKTYDSYRKEKD